VELNVKSFGRASFAVLLLILAIFSATGHLDRIMTSCCLAKLTQANDQYLKDSFDKSLDGFLTLSAIKSGVAVIEGSEVGIGFNLEVGDIVQSIYDYVDIAWKTALAGATILLLMRLVLQTIQPVSHWFLFGSLLLCLAALLLRWWAPQRKESCRVLKEFLLFLVSVTVALYLILPVSIAGASYLSKKITRPLIEEAQSGFESVEQDLTPQALNKRFFPADQEEESLWTRLDVKAKLENSKQAIIKMAQWLEGITKDFAIWTIKLIAGYLFDCIVFPMAFFIVVYILTRALLAYMFGMSRRQSMREDFEAVVKRYYDRWPAVPEGKPDASPGK